MVSLAVTLLASGAVNVIQCLLCGLGLEYMYIVSFP